MDCPLDLGKSRTGRHWHSVSAEKGSGMMPAAPGNRGLSKRRHVLALLGLLGLGTLVQAVVIGRATVPSLDSVRFARTARTAVEQGSLHVIRREAEQPLFPLWVAVVHETMSWRGGEFPSIWAASTQVAAAIPLVLTVVPIYFLLLRLFDLRLALIGAGLFCVLPEVRRLGADGISDSTHLFFLTVALWTTIEYWTARARTATGRIGRETAWLALAGFSTGLAVLVRAEAVILPVALLATISLEQVALAGLPGKSAAAILQSPSLVVHWSRSVFRAAAGPLIIHVCGAALVLVPYLAMAGAGTPQAAVARILGRAAPTASETQTTGKHLAWQTPEGRPLHFAVKEGSIRQRGFASALGQYSKELAAAFSYGAGALALWALWRHRRELTRPADRFLQAFFLVFSLAVIGFVAREGYLGARHLLPLLVAGLGMAALGVWEASVLSARILAMLKIPAGVTGVSSVPISPREQNALGILNQLPAAPSVFVAWAIMAVFAGGYFVAAWLPLRDDCTAHRRAGAWLAGQSGAGVVLDTRGWTALYSARPTYQYHEVKQALGDPRLAYVVVEPAELKYASDRAWTLRWLLATAGQYAARFDAPGGQPREGVAIYRWRPERLLAGLKHKEAFR